MKVSIWVRAALLVASVLVSVVQAGPILIYGYGTTILFGADNVLVGANYYDVRFRGGYASGGDPIPPAVGSLTISDAATASLASQALLDQVFVDLSGSTYNYLDFDSQPNLTWGCTQESFRCDVHTAFSVIGYGNIQTFIATNIDGTRQDSINYHGLSWDTYAVFADWSPAHTVPVPEPETLLLTLAALAALAFERRRRKAYRINPR